MELLIVDPQNDFCDLPASALPVAGATADLDRLAGLIRRHAERFDGITLTLDSHHAYDIAHPAYWRNALGEQPLHTPISREDVERGVWMTADPARRETALAYLARASLYVWPPHCLVGTWGHGIYEPLAAALREWECRRLRATDVLFKGLNPDTEHFSAFEADVPLDADPATRFDRRRVARLAEAECVVVAGEALSHCVASSVRSLVRHLGPSFAGRLVILTDCASPVPGFEDLARGFLEEMTRLGARLASSDSL
ncbi:isochorismatase family protein [Paludibacterium paludis]|uniref:Nicotinamidase n=1 Tax=Paludibacterium paludis TaxID=1225769 RepID=A0A918UAJ6_9NEIS|nr:isochorismatase family protein [Paludibacterium paludis]GGY22381.1 nicotinamidase [Paludibacterium paludis]